MPSHLYNENFIVSSIEMCSVVIISLDNEELKWTFKYCLVLSFMKLFWFLISNFYHVLNVVCFLLGNLSASEFYMPTFRNTLFHLHRHVGVKNDFFKPTCLWRWKRQSVPKRRHIKFRRRGITQKKAYSSASVV